MTNYIVATIKPWNIAQFHQHQATLPGNWHLISEPKQLTVAYLEAIKPKYIFFPHWSWLVPQSIISQFNCVAFHMTDLPYGRGGSPLQNLISRGHQDTMLSALQMTETFDAGPIYAKQPLSLKGSATEIFQRSAQLTFEMITNIVKNEPKPIPQQGEVTEFKRRTPEQSHINGEQTLDKIYDLIRMLDADGYPSAFIEHGNYQLTFSQAKLDGEQLSATVTFSPKTLASTK
ncbi:methionyl-tRNA formyltransferase [Thalassotalea euphylliae]|uniref:Methionyl-tRNA formyltransferase n=1 Tax=Thalassotalea euphylliae TaxID=1655234 RepID=A0A3E0UE25_9GAMM|nr:methionyl-tRNA formyltransferase [Thalassotalea euphylliae]REL34817.1 methionyl-tRNA formyltransferase [Thalassotalea euphylliae]